MLILIEYSIKGGNVGGRMTASTEKTEGYTEPVTVGRETVYVRAGVLDPKLTYVFGVNAHKAIEDAEAKGEAEAAEMRKKEAKQTKEAEKKRDETLSAMAKKLGVGIDDLRAAVSG